MDNYKRKIPVTDIPKIIKRRDKGETYISIAKTYGVSRERIRQILKQNNHPDSGDYIRAKRRSEENKKRVLELYNENNYSRQEIADIMNMHTLTITAYLKGLPIKSRKYTPEYIERIRKAVENNATALELKELLQINANGKSLAPVICNTLNRLGIKRNYYERKKHA
jgi:transposase-like protein